MDTISTFHSSNNLPQWVSIAQILGVPTLLGAALGALSSYLLFLIQTNKENKERREKIGETIITQVYSYNVTAGQEFLFEHNYPNATITEKQQAQSRFTIAAKAYNEMEAIADLFTNSKILESLEKIKSLIPMIQEEYKLSFKTGNPSVNRKDLVAGREYDKELDKLKKELTKWINYENEYWKIVKERTKQFLKFFQRFYILFFDFLILK